MIILTTICRLCLHLNGNTAVRTQRDFICTIYWIEHGIAFIILIQSTISSTTHYCIETHLIVCALSRHKRHSSTQVNSNFESHKHFYLSMNLCNIYLYTQIIINRQKYNVKFNVKLNDCESIREFLDPTICTIIGTWRDASRFILEIQSTWLLHYSAY